MVDGVRDWVQMERNGRIRYLGSWRKHISSLVQCRRVEEEQGVKYDLDNLMGNESFTLGSIGDAYRGRDCIYHDFYGCKWQKLISNNLRIKDWCEETAALPSLFLFLKFSLLSVCWPHSFLLQTCFLQAMERKWYCCNLTFTSSQLRDSRRESFFLPAS